MTRDQQASVTLNQGDGAGTGMITLLGGGGGCVRQSMNFHTAITTRITINVAMIFLVTGRSPLLLFHSWL